MVLIIDNYDSFTYNLVQYIGELGFEVSVVRNDALSVAEIRSLSLEAIVISPGPKTPTDAGVSLQVVREMAGALPLLGVCLGHQCIAQAYGGLITRSKSIVHGKTTQIEHDGRGIFVGLERPFSATRYHSLVVERATLPNCFEISGSSDGEIMAMRHRDFVGSKTPLVGVQFHPESIKTTCGKPLLRNFFRLAHS